MIALDIETSGIDPQHASILSIGALDTDDPTNEFYDECRAWDGAQINDSALAVNGFTREEVTDPSKKSEGEIVEAFLAWLMDDAANPSRNRTIVGQNSSFDRSFLKAACHRNSLDYPLADRTLDTHTMVWLHMTQHGDVPPISHQHSGLNTTAVLAYCGLPPEPAPHNALTGARIHAEIFSRIAYTRSMIQDFSTFEIPWNTTKTA